MGRVMVQLPSQLARTAYIRPYELLNPSHMPTRVLRWAEHLWISPTLRIRRRTDSAPKAQGGPGR